MAQVWLVTGSSRDLGRAIVEAGLAAGNRVLATARDVKSLADLSERYGHQVKLFGMDVTDEAAAANAVMAAVDVFGSLDVVKDLVACSATTHGVHFRQIRCSDYEAARPICCWTSCSPLRIVGLGPPDLG
jgi:NADP-dependent 3-hydroxy acid dehydrogenase YdfG